MSSSSSFVGQITKLHILWKWGSQSCFIVQCQVKFPLVIKLSIWCSCFIFIKTGDTLHTDLVGCWEHRQMLLRHLGLKWIREAQSNEMAIVLLRISLGEHNGPEAGASQVNNKVPGVGNYSGLMTTPWGWVAKSQCCWAAEKNNIRAIQRDHLMYLWFDCIH